MLRIAHISRVVLALMIALVAFGMSVGGAAAAQHSDGPQPHGRSDLSRLYRAEQQRLKIQDQRLTQLDKFAAKLDALIARLKAKQQDTAKLEAAVATLHTAAKSARAEWQAASDTLKVHAGFDDAGKVTDAEQARATLKDAHGHMEQAHQTAAKALREARAALVAFRKAHPHTPETPEPQEP